MAGRCFQLEVYLDQIHLVLSGSLEFHLLGQCFDLGTFSIKNTPSSNPHFHPPVSPCLYPLCSLLLSAPLPTSPFSFFPLASFHIFISWMILWNYYLVSSLKSACTLMCVCVCSTCVCICVDMYARVCIYVECVSVCMFCVCVHVWSACVWSTCLCVCMCGVCVHVYACVHACAVHVCVHMCVHSFRH